MLSNYRSIQLYEINFNSKIIENRYDYAVDAYYTHLLLHVYILVLIPQNSLKK